MKQQRPRTGFKQRNVNENVQYEEIMKYADLLYEEKYEDKIKGARNILTLIKEPTIMITILRENENLFDILSRTLRDENKKSMELSIILLDFFTSYSYFKQFHKSLLDQSIGEICMGIIDFQFMKYEYRRNEMIRLSTSDAVSKGEYQNYLDKFLFLVRKQDRILKLAFLTLLHLSEEYKTEYKMVKKDIVGCIMKNLGRQNINLLLELLIFLKKLSMFAVNKDTMIKNGILEKVMDLFKIGHPLIWKFNIDLLFNLSFDQKFRLKFLEKKEYFMNINELFKKNKEYRSIIIRFFYNLSLEEKSMPLFYESDCLLILNELIIKFPENLIAAELAALTLNLVTYPLNAKKIASKGRIKALIERALKFSDFHLIKIVKNILKYSDDDEANDDTLDDHSVINEIVEEYIDDYFMKILKTKSEGNEFLIETIEILSYIETDWYERLDKHKLIHFFEKELKENRYDDLLIAVIQFLGNVASQPDCSGPIAQSSIISLLYFTFQKKIDNYDIVFGIIYTLYQLMAFDKTRELIIANEDLINFVISCLKCNNEQIIFISTNFLEIVQLFNNKWSDIIKAQKFELFKNEANQFLKMKAQQLQEGRKMIPGGANYYDDEDDFDYDDGGYEDAYQYN